MKLVLLASGNGSLAQALIDARFDIAGLVTDNPSSQVIERAKVTNIDCKIIPFQSPRAVWDREIEDAVAQLNPDLVVSVGFMRILSNSFVKRFKVINSHPALLPNFPGAHAVRDALSAGETETGCTIHWVDEGVDTGEIIAQSKVEILPNDDVSTLHERIKVIERELIVETIRKLEAVL